MAHYYNEFDPKAAAWLRELIARGLVPAGDVDTRSIEDVAPDDLRGYVQCHFFAGIGGWAEALRLARVAPDVPLWTGSCPCQPFSAAGKGGGFDDERHLWPAFFHLIRVRRPRLVFGEQVASKPGLAWLDLVQDDLEGEDYAVGAGDLCAAGVGAPHIRQRLWWGAVARKGVDHASGARRVRAQPDAGGPAWNDARLRLPRPGSAAGGLDYPGRAGDERVRRPGETRGAQGAAAGEARERERSGPADRADGPVGRLPDRPGVGRERRAGPLHLGAVDQRRAGPADRGVPGRLPLADGRQRDGLADPRARHEHDGQAPRRVEDAGGVAGGGGAVRLGHGHGHGRGEARGGLPASGIHGPERDGAVGGVVDGLVARPQGERGHGDDRDEPGRLHALAGRQPPGPGPAGAAGAGPLHGFWGPADWLLCRDERWRPVEPGTFPLAHGVQARVGRLRGYGNAIVPQVGATFIEAFLGAVEDSAD